MNKFKLLSLFFASMFVGLIGYITLAYSEYGKVINYGEATRELGHKVLEKRDIIAGSMINGISNPYEISASLVQLEKDLQQLHQTYANTEIHSFLFKELETQALLDSFYFRSMETVDHLDHIVGHTVMRQFILQSLTDLLVSSSTNEPQNQIYGTLLSNISALEQSLNDDSSYINQQALDSATSPLITEETLRLAITFKEIEQQHRQLISKALSPEHITYLDQIEHGFIDLQDYLNRLIASITTALVILFFALCITIAIWR